MKKLIKANCLVMLFTALLFTTFAQAQIKVISWHKSNQKILKTYTPAPLIISRQELILELNNNIKKVTSMTESAGAWAGLIALNDRIATNQKTLFYFNDIAKDELISLFLEEKTTNGEVGIGNFDFCFDKYEDAQIFAENLYTILHHSYKELNLDSLLTAFRPVAEQYQTLEVKPAVPEEQRKYIVQANVLNEEKKYSKALNFYEKAIKINPVSYPAAYYNMALIAAQTEDFRYAIFNMKKYLMLKPAAEDSRAAQDKIYVWELKL